jgi:hypothetical protein
MRDLSKQEIDGYKYECLQFEPKKSLRIMTRLMRHLGAPLTAIMENWDSQKSLKEQDVGSLGLGEAFTALFSKLGDDEVYELCKDICSDVIAVGGAFGGKLGDEGKFDLHFKGPSGILRMIKVCKWALEVNYGDFIAAAVGSAGALAEVSGDRTSTRVR